MGELLQTWGAWARGLLPRALGQPDTAPISERVLWLALTVGAFALAVVVARRRAPPRASATPPKGVLLGRGGVGRNAFAGGVATATDFALAFALVQLAIAPAALATLAGCALGAIVNFSMNRKWTFGSNGPPTREAWRYLLVTSSSALFNAALVHVLLLPGAPFVLCWLVARVAVFLGWNYPLHRDYVFVREAG